MCRLAHVQRLGALKLGRASLLSADVYSCGCAQAPHREEAQQGMLELVVEELLRDADAGLDLALRWLSALAVAHCRPRRQRGLAAGASGDAAGGDTDMDDAAANVTASAEDSGSEKPNGVHEAQTAAAATADGLAAAATNPSDPRQRPAKAVPAAPPDGASTADATATAGAPQPWAGLSGSPYETALLALIKACRWHEEKLSVMCLGHSNPCALNCQDLRTMSKPP